MLFLRRRLPRADDQLRTLGDHRSISFETVVDWLAAGVNRCGDVFVQSKVPEHAELHLMLSMIAPLAWLERVPSYKDQQHKLHDRDLATYGFLGYPLLQAADILIYRAGWVPVGTDQVAHVELTRKSPGVSTTCMAESRALRNRPRPR